MKRIFFFLLLFLSFNIYSQVFEINNFHLSITPTFGYTTGEILENLYQNKNESNPDSLRSLLEWDKKHLSYGFDIESQYKKLHLDFSFRTSIPSNYGEMKDSDWMNISNLDMKTNYSVGTNKIKENYDFVLSTKYDFFTTNNFSISPVIQAQYRFDSFSREKNAKGWYGDSNWTTDGNYHWWYDKESMIFPSINPKTGKTRKILGIDYTQQSIFIWSGLNLNFVIKRLSFGFDFMLSPFTYFYAKDTHKGASTDSIYKEYAKNYFSSYKFALHFNYALSKMLDLTLNASHLLTATIKGEYYDDGVLNEFQKIGLSVQESSITLGCKIKIF